MLLGIHGIRTAAITAFPSSALPQTLVPRRVPVFLGNVHYEVTHDQLVDVLRGLSGIPVGPHNVQVQYHKWTGQRRGSATVWVATSDDQRVMCQLHGRVYLTPHNVYIADTAAAMDATLPWLLQHVRGARKAMVVEMPKPAEKLPPPAVPMVQMVYFVACYPPLMGPPLG